MILAESKHKQYGKNQKRANQSQNNLKQISSSSYSPVDGQSSSDPEKSHDAETLRNKPIVAANGFQRNADSLTGLTLRCNGLAPCF
jgi:hypothetical protein